MLMRATVSARWQQSLSLGLGLPLLLGLDPAAAADTADQTVTGITTGLGLFAALWAVVGVGGAPVGAGGLVAAASGVAPWPAASGSGASSVHATVIRVWWSRRGRLDASPAASAGAAASLAPRKPASLPAGFDCAAVLDAARTRFLRLQAAWDAADVATLQGLTTPDMLDELMLVLAARVAGPSRTDVVSLQAELLGLEELSAVYVASVEFSGVICESAEQGPVPFRSCGCSRARKTTRSRGSWPDSNRCSEAGDAAIEAA